MKLHRFTFNPYGENTYILYDETGEGIIIDPGMMTGSEQNELVNFMSTQNIKPVALLNTHCHIDHVLGNKFVFDQWGLKPQFHKGELSVLEAVVVYAPQMGIPYDVSPLPDSFLPESGQIRFGNSVLEIYFVPGHSPAHLCFYAPEENFLIGGDVLFYQSIGRTDLPGGNHALLLEKIETELFQNLPDDCIVYPGHGVETQIGFEKLNNPFLN